MFDLGWSEMGIVLLVALLVLGPKEMPKLARDLGRWVGKARSLAREFQRSLEDMAREAELDDVKKQIDDAGRELRRPQIAKRLEREVDPEGELGSAFDVEGDRNRHRPETNRPETDRSETKGGAEAPSGSAAAEDGGAEPPRAPASSGAGDR